MITQEADVRQTRIFARTAGDEQVIVYQNYIVSDEPAAMILPIPEATNQENAVEFINMENHEYFFRDLNWCFQSERDRQMREARFKSCSLGLDALAVEDVGSFIASYVPSQQDFERLDPQFRFSSDIWDELPQYENFGFVVFQFKAGKHEPHPMAFRFKTTKPDYVYFPTVHIHDGQLHDTGHFDHVFFTQTVKGICGLATTAEDLGPRIVLPKTGSGLAPPEYQYNGKCLEDNWEEEIDEEIARKPVSEILSDYEQFNFFDFEEGGSLWRFELRGTLPNKDFYVRLA